MGTAKLKRRNAARSEAASMHGWMHNCPVRLFVGVELPAPVVGLIASLPRPTREGLRWATRDQWHVTLRFLGEVDEPHAVSEALSGVPGSLHCGGVTASLGPATAWFAGGRVLQVPVTGLETLAGVVQGATARWGKRRESAFAGHVTLARFRGGGPGPAEVVGSPIAARFDVGEVVLFKSSLGAEGARYEVVSRVPIPTARRAESE